MAAHVVEIQHRPGLPLAVVQRQAQQRDLSRLIPECCGIVWQAVKAQHVAAGRHVAIYWDDAIRLEVGVEIRGSFVDEDEVVTSATPAGRVATVTHLGPYDTLAAAHDAIHRWAAATGHRLGGPRWEVYGHWQREWDADPAAIHTDVCYLLAD